MSVMGVRRWWAYGVVGLLAYGLFLAWYAPAPLAITLLAQRLPGLSVASANGTVFAGSAQGVRLGRRSLGQVRWQWRPWAVLTGALEYRVTVSEAELAIAALAAVDWSQELRLREVQGRLPLPRAIALAGRPPPPLSGEVGLALDELRVDRRGQPRAAHGVVTLKDIHTAFGRTLQLGDFTLALDSTEQAITGVVRASDGPLTLDGTLSLDQAGAYSIKMQVGVRTGEGSDLAKALATLAQRDDDGQWYFQVMGKWGR